MKVMGKIKKKRLAMMKGRTDAEITTYKQGLTQERDKYDQKGSCGGDMLQLTCNWKATADKIKGSVSGSAALVKSDKEWPKEGKTDANVLSCHSAAEAKYIVATCIAQQLAKGTKKDDDPDKDKCADNDAQNNDASCDGTDKKSGDDDKGTDKEPGVESCFREAETDKEKK